MSEQDKPEPLIYGPNRGKKSPSTNVDRQEVTFKSSLSRENAQTAWVSAITWAGIPVALIGFISFPIFAVGCAMTFFGYLQTKSDREFGVNKAKNNHAAARSASIIILILLPIRFLFLVIVGI